MDIIFDKLNTFNALKFIRINKNLFYARPQQLGKYYITFEFNKNFYLLNCKLREKYLKHQRFTNYRHQILEWEGLIQIIILREKDIFLTKRNFL